MSDKSAHKSLYRDIPAFTCKPGCSDCCGPVPVTEYEAKKLGISTPITPTKLGTCDCVYSSENGCTVYENRPFMCRVFGTVPGLECPHGKAPTKLISKEKAARMMAQYKTMGSGKASPDYAGLIQTFSKF